MFVITGLFVSQSSVIVAQAKKCCDVKKQECCEMMKCRDMKKCEEQMCCKMDERKFSGVALLQNIAKTVDKVTDAVTTEAQTKEEQRKQQLQVVSAVLNFAANVAANEAPAKRCAVYKDENDKTAVEFSMEHAHNMFIVAKEYIENNYHELVAYVKHMLGKDDHEKRYVHHRGGEQAVEVKPQISDDVIALVGAMWNFIDELVSQENISEYLKDQIDAFIDYLYGKVIGEIKEEIEEKIKDKIEDAIKIDGAAQN